MKKTNTKLQLKKSTVRVLQYAELGRVVGGEGTTTYTQDLDVCSSSCNVCPSQYSDCCTNRC